MKNKVMIKKIPKINIEQTEGSGRSYPYLYPIWDLAQGSFHKIFHVCTNQGSFHKGFMCVVTKDVF